jgi:hypothetical protein
VVIDARKPGWIACEMFKAALPEDGPAEPMMDGLTATRTLRAGE